MNRQQDQADGTSLQHEESGSPEGSAEDSDEFWVSDDIKGSLY